MSIDIYSGRALLAAASLMLASTGPALAECPPFPEVPWWKGLSHQSERRHVAVKYGGEWSDYIDRWDEQYKKVKAIHDRGEAIFVTKDKIRLEDESLESYIENIMRRLEVLRCMADEKTAAMTTASAAAPLAVAAVSTAGKGDPEAGRKKAHEAECVKCHGREGHSILPEAPNLAGQNNLYIVKQLKEFQKPRPGPDEPYWTTRRHNRIMAPRAATLGERDIWNLAAFFSSLPCSSGAQVASHVTRPMETKPCVECHGVGGQSAFPEIPKLAGQNKVYLAKQLNDFRNTATNVNRTRLKDERYHYLMAAQVKDLSVPEIDSLAKYFSSLSCR